MAECLKEIGKIIITQCLWPPINIKSHIDYWWCFDNNIQVLRDGVRDLERETFDINQRIEVARLRTENLRPGVEEWSKEGTEKLWEARRILLDDINPQAWNLISRYSMGKRAKKAAEEIAKHRYDGNFNSISDPAQAMRFVPSRYATDFESTSQAMRFVPSRYATDFESRKHIEEEIVKSLTKSSMGMIGICGMGGIGKTTMAQRIREMVMEEKLFDEVVMVVVSQHINMRKIQMEIAELLGLKFDVEGMSVRAHKLSKRLMDTNRKLIIFDDVWESLKFEDLGIPFENYPERCKVLLTSRSTDTCKGIKNKKVFELKVLEEEEAWILFKEKAGYWVEDSDLSLVAKDVVAKCKGLPTALVTFGTALRNQEKSIWLDTLLQLRQSNWMDFQVLKQVYMPLKLSYDELDNESERDLLLLCCLFPEDYDIAIELLTLYSMGLQLFAGMSSTEEARNITHGLVEKLKSRFLLIDGRNKLHVKMHVVVRDLVIYIGSTERNGFLKSLNKTSIESSYAKCHWMSVDISNEQMEIPVASRFPNLRLLMLLKSSSNEFSDISFQGMEDLNVLSFPSTWIGSLPPTLGLLKNLQTLCLFQSEVENISVIGELTSLDIFRCNGCENITELPAEIGRLNRLRLMELNGCSNLRRIQFGILSSLVRLEELKMLRSFDGWETEENGKEMRNASLTELESLSSLTCLEIEISDSNLAAQEICLSPKLVIYRIYIGFKDDWGEETDYEKVMKLNLPSDIGVVGKWIQILVKNTEWLYLEGDGSNNINLEECQDLRNLTCLEIEISDSNLAAQEICLSPYLVKYRIHIGFKDDWHKETDYEKVMKLNLPSDIDAVGKWIQILVNNTEWLYLEGDGSKNINLAETGNLRNLKFSNCSRVKKLVKTKDCELGIVFPMLETLSLRGLKDLEEICDGTIILNQSVSFRNLKSILITECSNLRYLFSVSVATTCLLQLEVLEILRCEAMEQVFRNEITDNGAVVCIEFPKLKKLELFNLPKLTAFCQGVQNIKFPQLTEMVIENLPKLDTVCSFNLRALFSLSMARANLFQLQVLDIQWCEAMEQVLMNEIKDIRIEFPNLKKLKLSHLPMIPNHQE